MLTAGATVPAGYYLDRDGLDLIAIDDEQGILPGEEGQRYLRLPLWIALVLGPLLGALSLVVIPVLAGVRAMPRLWRASWDRASTAGRVSLFLVELGRRIGAGVMAKARRRRPRR